MENALEIENLGKSYEGFRLENASFRLPQGYIMGMIGPNGAGKTTIIKLILGLVHRESGSIRVFGLDHLKNGVNVRSRIGFVHEVPHFYEHVSLATLKSIISPFYDRWDEKQFQKLMNQFGLSPTQRFGKLSRGMKMKFSLTLALSHHADLLILDEPTSGLDPASRQELLDLLQGLMLDQQKSVLFSTHITSDLERIADYITLVLNGHITFSETKDSVMEKWRIVKCAPLDITGDREPWIRGVRTHKFGSEILTDDENAARQSLGKDVVIEKASFEEIMFFLSRGGKNA